jgi:hypothetical protein
MERSYYLCETIIEIQYIHLYKTIENFNYIQICSAEHDILHA